MYKFTKVGGLWFQSEEKVMPIFDCEFRLEEGRGAVVQHGRTDTEMFLEMKLHRGGNAKMSRTSTCTPDLEPPEKGYDSTLNE